MGAAVGYDFMLPMSRKLAQWLRGSEHSYAITLCWGLIQGRQPSSKSFCVNFNNGITVVQKAMGNY